jgi:rubredoxin
MRAYKFTRLSQTVKLIEKIGDMKKWQCIVCGFIYDEAEGFEEEGIAPGTAWEDIPEDWVCPECGVGKADFEMIEID